jgi:hypothetical protein
MLLDNNGLIRAEGLIKSINVEAAEPYIEMHGGLRIVLATITAVNGIFVASYSECEKNRLIQFLKKYVSFQSY